MDNKQNKLLKDILNCVIRIDIYTGTKKMFTEYDNNPLMQDGVERNLITIGEAMNNLLKLNPAIAISKARKIVDTRHKLTHGYDEIENLQIWSVVINHLPTLKLEVEKLLNE